MRIELLRDAEADFLGALRFYAYQSPQAAEKFDREFQRICERLLKFPRLGVPEFEPVRKYSFNRFPFSLFYTLDNEVIYILAVAHQARRPGYWKDRLK